MGGAVAGPNRAPMSRLVAIRLGRPDAAAAVLAAWDRDDAITVLDPTLPPAVLEATLARLRPTHVVDDGGVSPWPGGVAAPDEVRAVVLTSGTTGTPKAVELTADGLAAVGAGGNAALDVTGDDRWLVCLPLHHVAGLAILARARVGGQGIVVHDGFDVAAVAQAPHRDGATVVSVVPTTLRRLLDVGAPLGDFRRVVVGGAPFPRRFASGPWRRARRSSTPTG